MVMVLIFCATAVRGQQGLESSESQSGGPPKMASSLCAWCPAWDGWHIWTLVRHFSFHMATWGFTTLAYRG